MNTYCQEQKTNFFSDYTVIDIETTGLKCEDCEIIEISALKVRNCEVVSEFSFLVKPTNHINSFITSLTGISNDMVKNALPVQFVLPKFIEFVSQDILLGHNINFDLRFIRYNLEKYFNKKLENKTIDTMQIARKYCKELKNHKLETIANFYNINTEGHHRALNDCIMTNEIYLKLKQEYSGQIFQL